MNTAHIMSIQASQIIIPILIFSARVIDVSMETIRIVFVSRGVRKTVALIGFFEKLIWLLAITQIMQHLNNPANYIAFAAGYSMGTFTGMSIAKRISSHYLKIRVITRKNHKRLSTLLSAAGYRTTIIDAEGTKGKVKVIYIIIKNKALDKAMRIIKRFDPRIFYTIEDVRYSAERDIRYLDVE